MTVTRHPLPLPRRALLAVLALALAVVGLSAPPAGAQETNLVSNGDFSDGIASWWGLDTDHVASGAACIPMPSDGAQFGNYTDLELVEGQTYRFGFTAWGDPATDGLRAYVETDGGAVRDVDETFAVTTEPQEFAWTFTATQAQRLQFAHGDAEATTFCLDDVYVTPVVELLANPDFDGQDPWWTAGGLELAQDGDGPMCGAVPASTNPWDVILGQGGVTMEEGTTYTVSLTASAMPETTIRLVVEMADGSYTAAYDANPLLRADGQTFEASFTSGHSGDAQFMLQMGGNAGFDFCIDRASLTMGGTVEAYEPDTGPRVRVNQVGYLPHGPKHATLVTDATAPLPWELRDAGGAALASGTTTPEGVDESAGLNVHTIDFSAHTTEGSGLTLVADGEESYPFAISATLYDQLRRDALNVYYSQRSGIAIDDAIKPGYGRPAGHVSSFGGDDVNQGDLDVPCLPNERTTVDGAQQRGGLDHYLDEDGDPEGWTCPEGYALDVTGGWYDAGDHGKYVVNSGITVWQLLATYERNQLVGVADRDALGDGTLKIPEAGNGIPDILDEVRWNLEWMLAMQVPDGTQMGIGGETVDAGGLVHHKLHDIAWTGLNLFPHEDPMPRYLHRPSTAATLNLAAAAAHGARLYAEFDPDFADDLMVAARRAWAAAQAHPDIYAPNTNDLDPNPGGGPYDDDDVSDERYWAAAQLYLTTGEPAFLDAVLASPHHTDDTEVWRPLGFDWGHTAAAGRLSLAVVPSDLPDRRRVIHSVRAGADAYLAIQAGEPFGHPYGPDAYDWGSNHQVINNAVVIATAYDVSGKRKYLEGALEAIDYVLGRNALNNSYVTAYGTRYSENMHSRWYAHSLTDRMPRPPDGKLAGGANSGIQDPVAQRHLQGCAPQFCYIDHIDSWSTNETTINWNASLAWWASFAADMGDGAPEWPTFDMGRLAGRTRVQTAIDIAQARFPDGAQTVVLARADAYPDALTGAPLAFAENAPILLSLPEELHPATAAEIERLGATRVILLGGHAALSESVADALRDAGLSVDRVHGANRFDTAARIAARLGPAAPTALVALGGHPHPGRGWPDALAAAPLAAAAGQPILLVTTDVIPRETREALQGLGTTHAVVVGGTGVVSQGVADALATAGHALERVSGRTRYETSRALFDRAVADGADPDQLWLATGRNWPDALAGGPAVAAAGGALLLVDPETLQSSPATRAVIRDRGWMITSVHLLGGPGAISAAVEQEVRALLR